MVEMLCGLMLLWATLHTPVLTWLWVVAHEWLTHEPPPGATQTSPDDGLVFCA